MLQISFLPFAREQSPLSAILPGKNHIFCLIKLVTKQHCLLLNTLCHPGQVGIHHHPSTYANQALGCAQSLPRELVCKGIPYRQQMNCRCAHADIQLMGASSKSGSTNTTSYLQSHKEKRGTTTAWDTRHGQHKQAQQTCPRQEPPKCPFWP